MLEVVPQPLELAAPSDERRVETTSKTRRRRINSNEAVGVDRRRLALEHQRRGRLTLDRVANERSRLAADQDVARLRGLLQPRGDVDSVAGDKRLALARDHFAGVDADAQL